MLIRPAVSVKSDAGLDFIIFISSQMVIQANDDRAIRSWCECPKKGTGQCQESMPINNRIAYAQILLDELRDFLIQPDRARTLKI